MLQILISCTSVKNNVINIYTPNFNEIQNLSQNNRRNHCGYFDLVLAIDDSNDCNNYL